MTSPAESPSVAMTSAIRPSESEARRSRLCSPPAGAELPRPAREALAAGIHRLIVDLFRPGARDPQGIHRAVWGDDCGEDYDIGKFREMVREA